MMFRGRQIKNRKVGLLNIFRLLPFCVAEGSRRSSIPPLNSRDSTAFLRELCVCHGCSAPACLPHVLVPLQCVTVVSCCYMLPVLTLEFLA